MKQEIPNLSDKVQFCECETPQVETCVLSGIKFCMKCINPIKQTNMLIGVAVDPYKEKPYIKAIAKAGFTIEHIDQGANFKLLQIKTDENGKLKLAKLIKKLERKYSLRNRMN